MRQPIRSTIGSIFSQVAVALFAFVLIASLSDAEAANAQRHLTEFHALDSVSYDRQLAGRLRASIAFERKLSIHKIDVEVSNGHIRVSGTLPNHSLMTLLEQKILELVPAHQMSIAVDLTDVQKTSETANNQGRLSALW